ncbi:uncharacterized protein A4U43_C08F35640 [Asparagus officinalis]|nr:uncharacterized protein A4U43_C08F35640 [Asparagus officinalis]
MRRREDIGGGARVRVRVGKFRVCDKRMREYIPCLDNVEAIKRLRSTERGERFERFCPERALDCLVPAPKDYKSPIPWPQSRDEVWFSNVPHSRLVEDKGGQNWITRVGDKFVFPGGGTQFIHGADKYLDQIAEMVPDVAFEMEDLTTRMCWELVKKEGYIAMWRKPLNNSCYVNRDPGVQPPLCDVEDDPNSVWYVNLKPCISQLPENGYGTNLTAWPARLHEPPKRLQDVEMDSYIAKNELFKAEARYWKDIVEGYIRVFRWKTLRLRNIMDMRAGFGGFAAAINDQQINSWVMNVVPVSGHNTLPVIYDRGLIGVAHDWCESFDTYPRTYDLLHASGLFSRERKRCNITLILLEMDRILRPGGLAYIRDSKSVLEEIKEITEAMGWRSDLRDTSGGPYANRKILTCQK